MSVRYMILGLAVACGVSAWAWCRPCESVARAQGADSVLKAEPVAAGSTQEEALARYRTNASRHWKQIALKR
jgi:hypothetical protein